MTEALMFDLDNTLYSENTGMEARVLAAINEFVGAFLDLSPEAANLVRRNGVKLYGTTLEWLVFEKGFDDPEAYFTYIHPENEIELLVPDPGLPAILDSLPYPKRTGSRRSTTSASANWWASPTPSPSSAPSTPRDSRSRRRSSWTICPNTSWVTRPWAEGPSSRTRGVGSWTEDSSA
jgi:hypothetical protein